MNLLDPHLYAGVRRPPLEAETLPPWCYHSEDFYRLEARHIFRTKWLLVGRTEEWTQPGEFIAYERFGVPFFIALDQDQRLHAYANSCRHRGMQLVRGKGKASTFVCPYHSWVYGLDGSLRRAPGMESTRCFESANYGLVELRLELWRGFVFVNLSQDCEPLSAQLGNLDDHLASYDLDNVVTVGRDEYEVATNWKQLVENSMEWLHHPTVHKQSIAGKVGSVNRNVIIGDPGEYVLLQSQANGVSRATLDGETGFPPLSTLRGAAREGSHYVLIYPYAMLGCDLDAIWYKQMIPEGPGKVRNIATYCFHKETLARPDYEEIAPRYIKRYRKVVGEDNVAMELQLKGLTSPYASPGRFSDREILVHRIDNWVLDQILGREKKVASSV
jgi:phenylpropionate dioxygenase-like ring-hydroxylating dioxygenase large terminal subunit